MTLLIRGHDYRFEMENICRLFLPQERVVVPEPGVAGDGGAVAATELRRGERETVIRCRLELEDFREELVCKVDNGHPSYGEECELEMATLLYRLFERLFGCGQDWGIVTGVRPIKLLRRLVRLYGREEALWYYREKLLVSERKTGLALRTLEQEDAILALSRPDSFSLYVSIPFCPSRCDYCSFVSQTVTRAAKLVPAYVELLTQELRETGRIAASLGLRLETVYFGGGTPTTLTAEQLARLLQTIGESFDLSHLREYTVEAGRPDTVTADKFRAMKAAGVSRISINPQTLQDRVLEAIGRRHTAAQFYEAYDLARRCGMDHINTDLIAGLPGDDYEGFRATVEGILALDPESVTVHTLSMKRASNLVIQRRADYGGAGEAARMVAFSAERLPEAGYRPYYLYRQSRTAGNQENVGWAKPGCEGLYNVFIMDETHTILGCGAGAVTKLKQPGTDYLERIFNFKFPYEYNARFEEMLARKGRIGTFYEEKCSRPPAASPQ